MKDARYILAANHAASGLSCPVSHKSLFARYETTSWEPSKRCQESAGLLQTFQIRECLRMRTAHSLENIF
jgi:hypothetical protein